MVMFSSFKYLVDYLLFCFGVQELSSSNFAICMQKIKTYFISLPYRYNP